MILVYNQNSFQLDHPFSRSLQNPWETTLHLFGLYQLYIGLYKTQLSYVATPTLADMLKWVKLYHGCRTRCKAGLHWSLHKDHRFGSCISSPAPPVRTKSSTMSLANNQQSLFFNWSLFKWYYALHYILLVISWSCSSSSSITKHGYHISFIYFEPIPILLLYITALTVCLNNVGHSFFCVCAVLILTRKESSSFQMATNPSFALILI